MKSHYRCRIARVPEDQDMVESLSYRIWDIERPDMSHEDIPPTIRPDSTTLVLEYYGEPVGTIRIEERTPTSLPLRIEELLLEAGLMAEYEQITALLARLLPEGIVGGISAWEVIPTLGRQNMRLGGILLASALRFCERRGIRYVTAFMEVNTKQNRFLPHMARVTRIMRFFYPAWQETHDLWLADLSTINPIGRELLEAGVRGVFEV